MGTSLRIDVAKETNRLSFLEKRIVSSGEMAIFCFLVMETFSSWVMETFFFSGMEIFSS